MTVRKKFVWTALVMASVAMIVAVRHARILA